MRAFLQISMTDLIHSQKITISNCIYMVNPAVQNLASSSRQIDRYLLFDNQKHEYIIFHGVAS